jgi:hypothetical protein
MVEGSEFDATMRARPGLRSIPVYITLGASGGTNTESESNTNAGNSELGGEHRVGLGNAGKSEQ